MPQPRKRFGQHFLHDKQVIDRILRMLGPQPGDRLLEIGPGRGALTYPLLHQCDHLIAVELDRDLISILQNESQKYGSLKLINEDILQFEMSSLDQSKAYRLVGNLPYNISTPLMFHLLKSVSQIQDMHFMVQQEVALRIVAKCGENNYGRLSIMLQYHCECQYLFEVPPSSFTPPPKVDSAIIRMTPRQSPEFPVTDYDLFSRIVKSAFSQRRKTISNSLKTLISRETLAECNIDPMLRAENLSLEDYAKLTQASLMLES